MTKSTLFTIFATVIVTLGVAALLGDGDFLGDSGQTDVMRLPSAEVPRSGTEALVPAEETDRQLTSEPIPVEAITEESDAVIEIADDPISDVSRVSEALVAMSGFTGPVKRIVFRGKLFQLFDIADLQKEAVFHSLLYVESVPVIAITETVLLDELAATNFYDLIKNKSKPYVDLSVNETNGFGDRSFYLNHAKKPSEAFLVVKIGSRVYSFAYLKVYHQYVEEISSLLIQKDNGS